jgi:uncharacterized membrane protein YkvA (DUF1232 family)
MSWNAEGLKRRARAIKRDIGALALAMRDPRTPKAAKLMAVIVVAYALSPIDLIPDFVPVLGYLDDLILLPLGILAVRSLIPRPLLAEFRTKAEDLPPLSSNLQAAVAIVLLWIAAAAASLWLAIRWLG